MLLTENKSAIWFKVLNAEGRSIDEEDQQWSLPKKGKKGAWTEFTSPMGTCLFLNPNGVYQSGLRVFVAELPGRVTVERSGVVWVAKTRLVREATNMDLKRFGIIRAIIPAYCFDGRGLD